MGLILEIDTRRSGDHTTVLASGELDMATQGRLLAELERHLAGHETARLTLDLTELHFCDAAGLAALLTASRLAQVEQVDFEILSSGESPVRSLLDHTGLADEIPLGFASQNAPAAPRTVQASGGNVSRPSPPRSAPARP